MTSAQASFPRWLLHLPGPGLAHLRPGPGPVPVSTPAAGPPHDDAWQQYWLATWTSRNADWKPVVVAWGPGRCREFVAAVFPWFAPVYDAYPDETYRRDVVRYLFAFAYGGMYVEPTMECLRSVGELRSVGVDVMLGSLDDGLESAYSLPPHFFLSMPRATFWLFVLEFLVYPDVWPGGEFIGGGGALDLTGARVLRLAYLEAQKPGRPWTSLRVAQHFQAETRIPESAWAALQVPLPPALQAHWGLGPIPSRIGVLGPKAVYPLNWQDPAHARFHLDAAHAQFFNGEQNTAAAADDPRPSLLAKQSQAMRATFPHAYAVDYW